MKNSTLYASDLTYEFERARIRGEANIHKAVKDSIAYSYPEKLEYLEDTYDEKTGTSATAFRDKDTGEVIYAILREGPGCCYNDSVIGFEYITDGKYPEKDKWYEMVGEVITDNYKSGKVVKLKLIEIKEIEAKGKLIHIPN